MGCEKWIKLLGGGGMLSFNFDVISEPWPCSELLLINAVSSLGDRDKKHREMVAFSKPW